MPTKTTTKIMSMDPDEFWQAQNKALNTTTVAKTKRDPIAETLAKTKSDAAFIDATKKAPVVYPKFSGSGRHPKAT